MIYGNRSNGNQHGLVLTKPSVVEFMLDRIGYVSTSDLSSKIIVEPAAGDGAFAIKIIERLHASSKIFGFSFQEALSNIKLYELDSTMSKLLSQRISLKLVEFSATLPKTLIHTADFLVAEAVPCDFVVGNPPYVRHENIPEKEKQTYRKLFRTFTHRSDLYIAFYEKSLRVLNKSGILSFICSNRWLKNQYEKLLLLAAILMSGFVKDQLLELGNKMNGGYPRWQSQNLKKLRVPIIDAIPESSAKEIILAYQSMNYQKIDLLITPSEISNYETTVPEALLFEPDVPDYE